MLQNPQARWFTTLLERLSGIFWSSKCLPLIGNIWWKASLPHLCPPSVQHLNQSWWKKQMAFCCCCCFFKDNLLFSKHLQLLLSKNGWREALVFPGGNMCSGFLQTSRGSATPDKGSRQEVVWYLLRRLLAKNDYSIRVESGSLQSPRWWRKRLLFLPKPWDSNRRQILAQLSQWNTSALQGSKPRFAVN